MQNLALNVAEKGFNISVFNRTYAKTEAAVVRAKKSGATPISSCAAQLLMTTPSIMHRSRLAIQQPSSMLRLASNGCRSRRETAWLRGHERVCHVSGEAAVCLTYSWRYLYSSSCTCAYDIYRSCVCIDGMSIMKGLGLPRMQASYYVGHGWQAC